MTDKEVLLLRRKLDLLLRTGKLLMESAAERDCPGFSPDSLLIRTPE